MTARRDFLIGASTLMGHALFADMLASFDAAAEEAPRVFTPAEMRALEALVDVVLPETDSPPASAAATHRFIDHAMAACATEAQQETMRAGLAALEARARRRYHKSFVDLAPDQQGALLRARASADMARGYDQSFFKILKDYALVGYFHSEIGATQALAYQHIPGGYVGDIALAPGQKAWAT